MSSMPDFNTEIKEILFAIYRNTEGLDDPDSGKAHVQHRDAKGFEDELELMKKVKRWDGRYKSAKGLFWDSKKGGFGAVATKVMVKGTGEALGVLVEGGSVVAWAIKPYFTAAKIYAVGSHLDEVYAIMGEKGYDTLYPMIGKSYKPATYKCTCEPRSEKAFISWIQTRKAPPLGYIGGRLASYATDARGNGRTCKEIMEFYQSQKEKRVAKMAINISGVGAVLYLPWVGIRGLYKRCKGTIHQQRDMAAMDLICNALPVIRFSKDARPVEIRDGCIQAQALIAFLLRELDIKNPDPNSNTYPGTITALLYPNGFYSLSSAFSAAVVTDMPNMLRKWGKTPKWASNRYAKK